MSNSHTTKASNAFKMMNNVEIEKLCQLIDALKYMVTMIRIKLRAYNQNLN